MSAEKIFDDRKNKFLRIGRTKGFISHSDDLNTLSMKENKINKLIEKIVKSKTNLGIFSVVIISLSYLIFFL